jgi:hypothetical protein
LDVIILSFFFFSHANRFWPTESICCGRAFIPCWRPTDRERAYLNSIVSFFSFSFFFFLRPEKEKKMHVSTQSDRLVAWKKETRIAPSLPSRDSRSLFAC